VVEVVASTMRMEVRVIVWNTRRVVAKDKYTSDVKVICELVNKGGGQSVDTHNNCKPHEFGMFNWRMVPALNSQIFDSLDFHDALPRA
jgi:hypothetical protein